MLRSHTEDNELLNLASSVLEKIIPIHVKDPSASPSGKLKSLINFVSTHFESLEKSAEVKVWKDFDENRFSKMKRMIVNDRDSLSTWVKCIHGALYEGGNIYNSCIIVIKFTTNFDERIKEQATKLVAIS
jgi:hypothetical protein